jgi:osmoprotectant transport system ATP-binding protein
MRICDIMHKGVIFCYPEDNLKTVAAMLKENQLRSVVVIHESGEVWGLVSLFEIIKHYGQDLTAISAEQAMQPYKIDVDPQWPLEKAVDLMKKKRIQHLIIVDPHAGLIRPVAILTSFDVVRYMANIHSGEFSQMLRLAGE